MNQYKNIIWSVAIFFSFSTSLKAQEKNKFWQLKTRQYEYTHNQSTSKRALMLAKHNKNNYNIIKEHKR